jgi:hypothetical protein
MSEIERRTIDELVARYELEPDLRDLYVEGLFDKDVISACLASSKGLGFAIYEIDGVEVPADLVFSNGLTDGNKQRVIVLARELKSMMSCDCSVVCLVDRDLDHWLQELENARYLKWTRFCSIEACFSGEGTIKAILVDFLGSKISNFSEYFNSLIDVLKAIYSLRLADKNLSLGLRWIAFDKYLSRDGNCIKFDLDTYINRLLINNSKLKEFDNFCCSYKQWAAALTGDFRQFFRGHDLVDLLAWSVKPFSGIKPLASALSVERAMVLLAGKSQEVISELQAEIS